MVMKSKLVTASTGLLFFAMLICTVSAQNVELLSKGDTFTYERYHIWTSNDPKATQSRSVDFFTRNNSIVTVRIENVSSTVIKVQITIQYRNGTQRTDLLSRDIVSGYNTPYNMSSISETIAMDFIQKPQEQADHTETRTYGEIAREVNVFSTKEQGWTMIDNTVYNVTIAKKRCYDAQTGMFIQSESEFFMFDRTYTNLNATILDFFVLKNTNMWVVPKPPSNPPSLPSYPLLPLLMIAAAIMAAVAAVVYLKKLKR